jgi:hypothetical protein
VEILQKAIERELQGLSQEFLSQLIANKLALQGIKISAPERKLLARHIRQGASDTYRLRGWRFWNRQHIQVAFTSQEIEQADRKFTEFIENRLPGLVQAASEDASRRILADLKRK